MYCMGVNILINIPFINKQNIFVKIDFNYEFYLVFWTSLNPPSANVGCRCDGWFSAAFLDHEVILKLKANLEESREKRCNHTSMMTT